jgi:hypothetical protein
MCARPELPEGAQLPSTSQVMDPTLTTRGICLDRRAGSAEDPRVNVLSGFRRAPQSVSALLVVAMLLFVQTCAQHGATCAAPYAGESHSHSEVAHDPDGCADHDGGSADQDGCADPGQGCSRSSICCSTWAPAPATLGLQAPPAVPVAFAGTGSLLQPMAALVSAPAPIPRGSPPLHVSILRL